MVTAIWSIINRFLNKGFFAIFAVVLGNYLLPETLGMFVAFILLARYGVGLFCVNFGAACVAKINHALGEGDKSRLFWIGLLSVTSLAAFIALAVGVFYDFLTTAFGLIESEDYRLWLCCYLFVAALKEYLNHIMGAYLRQKNLAITNIFGISSVFIVTIFLFYQGYSLAAPLIGLLVGDTLIVLLLGVMMIGRHTVIDRVGKHEVAQLWRFSLLLHVGAVAVFVDNNIDLLLINTFLGKTDLAIYNYAIKGGLLLVVLGGSFSAVTYPMLSKAYFEDKVRFRRIYGVSMRITGILVALAALWSFIFFEEIIGFLLPPEYLEAKIPYGILLIGISIFACFTSVGCVFPAANMPSVGILMNWIAVLVNLFLSIILIPHYGIVGAALATSTSFIVRTVWGIVLVERRIDVGEAYWPIIAGAVILGIAMLSSNLTNGDFIPKLFISIVSSILSGVVWLGRREVSALKEQISRLPLLISRT